MSSTTFPATTVTRPRRMNLAARTVQFIDGITVLQARHAVIQPDQPFTFSTAEVRDHIDPRLHSGRFSATVAALLQMRGIACVTEDRVRNRVFRVLDWEILQGVKRRHFSPDGEDLSGDLRRAAAAHYREGPEAPGEDPAPVPQSGLLQAYDAAVRMRQPRPWWRRLFTRRADAQRYTLLRLARIEAKLDHLLTLWE